MKCGLSALPDSVEGAVVCLGDMPRVTDRVIDRLIRSFDPKSKRSIVVPTFGGQWGNPVLIGRQHFSEVATLNGDRGARPVIERHAETTAEVAISDNSILFDVDTPEALESVKS